MNTRKYTFYTDAGVPFTIIAPDDMYFPSFDLSHYKPEISGTYCGVGHGIGDVIVPDTIWGLYVTLACFIHDNMWEFCDANWNDFHYSNSVFLRNIISIIESASKSSILKHIRMYRAVTYYNAVDSVGKSVFWKMKEVKK